MPSVRARSHLAWTLAEMGDFHGARTIAEDGLRIADAAEHPYTLSHACLGLGGARVRQGEFETAISILSRGLAATEHVPLLRPPIAADLGVAHARCGRLAEGLAQLDAAVEGARAMGRFGRLPLMLVKCGEIHLLAGDTAAATRLANDALGLATAQKEQGNEVYARLLLAQCRAREARREAEALLRRGAEACDAARHVAARRALPRGPVAHACALARPGAGAAAPDRGNHDVPRDGDALLAGGGGARGREPAIDARTACPGPWRVAIAISRSPG